MSPGIVWPLGEVPMTVPAAAVLFIALTWSATWKPEARNSSRALSWLIPFTLGTRAPGAPSTYRGSVGGMLTSPKSSAIGFIAANQVSAGSLPPNRSPLPHRRSG
jgi:hypothetical protein